MFQLLAAIIVFAISYRITLRLGERRDAIEAKAENEGKEPDAGYLKAIAVYNMVFSLVFSYALRDFITSFIIALVGGANDGADPLSKEAETGVWITGLITFFAL